MAQLQNDPHSYVNDDLTYQLTVHAADYSVFLHKIYKILIHVPGKTPTLAMMA